MARREFEIGDRVASTSDADFFGYVVGILDRDGSHYRVETFRGEVVTLPTWSLVKYDGPAPMYMGVGF